ncbi:MAG: hypothetical protein BGO63_03725 [Candidatus Accumulibacter sp. 66-26]|nr:MAG: hypothetical protein BGO63_03725 [Candidatus Accumulibacter sp. 66-26]
MNKLHQDIGALASKVLQSAMASGLSWDESVAAFGLAAKALADGAAKEGDGSSADCQAHAQKRFTEGFAQTVQLVFVSADLSQLKQAYSDDPAAARTILKNANTHVLFKPH